MAALDVRFGSSWLRWHAPSRRRCARRTGCPDRGDKLTDAQKKGRRSLRGGRGYAGAGPFVPLIRSPEVCCRQTDGRYLRFKSTLGRASTRW